MPHLHESPEPPSPVQLHQRPSTLPTKPTRRQSSHSSVARSVLLSQLALSPVETNGLGLPSAELIPSSDSPPSTLNSVNKMDGHTELQIPIRKDLKPIPGLQSSKNGVGIAASDTPLPSEPSSPKW